MRSNDAESRRKGKLLMICLGDARSDKNAETLFMSTIRRILSKTNEVKILDLSSRSWQNLLQKSYSPLWTSIILLLHAGLGEKVRLLRTLSKERGTVWVNFLPLALVVVVFRMMARRHYSIVLHMNGVPRNSTAQFAHHLLTSFLLRHSDGAVTGEMCAALPQVRRFSRRYALIAPVLLNEGEIRVNEDRRQTIRRTLRLEGKVGVAVLGPFFAHNKPVLSYVRLNLDRFDPAAVFVFIGKCHSGQQIQNPRTLFVGEVDDFQGYLSALDCAIIPIYNKEGAPSSKIIHAMAAGLAVITDSAENMHVTNGKELLVGCTSEFPQILNRLIQDNLKMKEIGLNGRNHVEQNYAEWRFEDTLRQFISALDGTITSDSEPEIVAN